MRRETPEDFRERAAHCERLAKHTETPGARETLLYVAARWRAMAEVDEYAAGLVGTTAPSGVG